MQDYNGSRNGKIAAMRTRKTGGARGVQRFHLATNRACPEHSYRPAAHLIISQFTIPPGTIAGNEVLFSVASVCLFVSKMCEQGNSGRRETFRMIDSGSRIMPNGNGRSTHCWSKIHNYQAYSYFLSPRKTRQGKKLKKLKRMERLMFRAVVQLKTIDLYLFLLIYQLYFFF